VSSADRIESSSKAAVFVGRVYCRSDDARTARAVEEVHDLLGDLG
jgi:hypothetical protein